VARLPRFTIVLPVRNGGSYVKEAVESVLAQSVGDFTLEILENHSADGTAEWLETLQDARIHRWPAPAPLSIEENWRRAVALSKAEFMLFLGHDDRLDPDYLSVVDTLTRRAPDAALFTTHFRLIDAAGRVIRRSRPMPARETLADFLRSRLTSRTDMTAMGVAMRSRAHDAVGGIPAFAALAHADDALWLRVLGGSWKATAPEEAFSYRWHRASTFGSLPWRAAVTALEQFAAEVHALADTRADVAEIWRTHAARFLTRRYRYILLSALMRDGANGLGDRERAEILASLDRLDPRAAERLRRSWRVRLGAWIGRGPAPSPLGGVWEAYWRLRWRWAGTGLRVASIARGRRPGRR
jgi:glycosyltransferase involved in cell wall biosynthesis